MSQASKVKIHSFTMILGRMEVSHLREWLMHQLMLGVDKVHIVLEHEALDSRSSQRKPGKVWAKKPGANYHQELTDGQVAEVIFDICESVEKTGFMEVEVLPGSSSKLDLGKRQVEEFNLLVERLRGDGELPDWMIFTDVDELICTPGRSFRELLAACPAAMSMIYMKQWLFADRWDSDGSPLMMKQINECYGYLNFNKKGIYRLAGESRVSRLRGVHGKCERTGPAWKPQTNVIRFHHYRGIPSDESCALGEANGVRGLRRYCKVREKLQSAKRVNQSILEQRWS